jgi:starch phosphorylase
MAGHEKLLKLLDRPREVDLESIIMAFVHHLEYSVGKYKHDFDAKDVYQALALTMRDFLIDRWNETQERHRETRAKRVYYLSLEFLLGQMLTTNLVSMGMREAAAHALREIGFDLSEIADQEPDAGLGNGGLGRLAACFLDSLATLDLPGYGCGIRYEYGIFRQQIVDGYQKEAPDGWLSRRNPWEVRRGDLVYPIPYYGYTELIPGARVPGPARWVPGETVLAMAYDVLVPGFNTRTVNHIRLWCARASSEFNLDYFNHGDYLRAVEDQQRSQTISKVLYPNENVSQGRELRLKQQFMLVSASLQDALRTFREEETDWRRLPDRAVFQLNDTHPAMAVAELMRLLVDVHGLDWELAWSLTTQCLAYTNHTVLPEALERWEVELFGRLLPRHLEIIYLINHFFLEGLRNNGTPEERIAELSIVDEGPPRRIRMANLAVVGSRAVNGVSALHTEILRNSLFREFHEMWPEKFQNKTNGITPRRWIVASNPDLTALITSRIGKEWIVDLGRLRDLEEYAEDPELQAGWERTRRLNKERLAKIIAAQCGVTVDLDSLFDVQVKRIHEYKRQLLNVLRLIGDYRKLKANPSMWYPARTVLFGGKAAPGYHRAKLLIKLVHAVADVVNQDPDVAGRLRVAFLPDYRVSLAEKIIPAADLSEQISTAGTEASGTGNMKFMLNGALTVGTLDGANIEILEEVGPENIYIFGHTVDEIEELRRAGYRPFAYYERDLEIRGVLDALRDGTLGAGLRGLFDDLFDSLTYHGDRYFLLADYHAYVGAQERIARDFQDRRLWLAKSIRNTARSGRFSSDRTIAEYAQEIWGVEPVTQRPPRIRAL